MTIFDIVNAAFEACGGLFVAMNVRQVWKHRLATGVHWVPVAFFTAWGFWNMVYYPALDQWFSAICGAGVCLANCAYLYSVWKFRPRKTPIDAGAREPKAHPIYDLEEAIARGAQSRSSSSDVRATVTSD